MAGYVLYNKPLKSYLPKDTIRYKLELTSKGYYYLNLYVAEYYTDAFGNEYSRWVYDYYTSSNYDRYYTLTVDIVHRETQTIYKKKTLLIDKVNGDNRFYDPTLEEKLGGEVMTLGG